MRLRGCVTADVGRYSEYTKGAALLKIASSTRYGRIAFGVLCDGKGDERAAGNAAAIAAEYYEKWFLKELPQILKEAESDLISRKDSGMKARVLTEMLAREDLALSHSALLFHEASAVIKSRLEYITNEINVRISGKGRLNGVKIGTVAICMLIMGGEYLLMRMGRFNAFLKDGEGDLKNLTDFCPDADTADESDTGAEYLGMGRLARPVFVGGKIHKGMGLLLCSDGFVRMQDHEKMRKKMRGSSSYSEKRMDRMLRSLMRIVRKKGEKDDMMAVYLACTD